MQLKPSVRWKLTGVENFSGCFLLPWSREVLLVGVRSHLCRMCRDRLLNFARSPTSIARLVRDPIGPDRREAGICTSYPPVTIRKAYD